MRIIQLKKIVTGIVAAFVLFSSSAAFACNDSNAKIGENGLAGVFTGGNWIAFRRGSAAIWTRQT